MVHETRYKDFKEIVLMISVIIPTLNEENSLSECLESFAADACEIIVVDAQSTDQTVSIAQSFGVKIIQTSVANRAVQMNIGARNSQGEVLLFFHADSRLPQKGLKAIASVLETKDLIGGGFRLSYYPDTHFYRLLASWGNLFCRFTGTIFGDRGIFIRKDDFEQLGGYPEIAIMEDVALMEKMQERGRIVLLPLVVKTSARKYISETMFQVIYSHLWSYVAYGFGVSPEKIYQRYYGLDKTKDSYKPG